MANAHHEVIVQETVSRLSHTMERENGERDRNNLIPGKYMVTNISQHLCLLKTLMYTIHLGRRKLPMMQMWRGD